jgi:lipoprotein-releasing system permease protein
VSWVSLPFPLYVAQRYLRSSRRDAFVTFLSLSAAGGIALGVAALIFSSAALGGFQKVLRDEVLLRTPHIEIALPAGVAPDEIRSAVRIEGTKSVRVGLQGKGWLLVGGRAQPVEIFGFEAELPAEFPGATSRSPGLFVSDRLAEAWGLEVGEIAEIVSARATLTPLGPQPRVQRLPVGGTFEAGRTEQEDRIAVPVSEAILLFGESGLRLLVGCEEQQDAEGIAETLRSRLPEGSTVKTWKDLNQALFFLLKLEKSLMFIAVFLIVVVAAMAVVSDLMLILAHKQGELGMLGAMGTRPEELRRIFLWLGALLVVFGAAVGTALGIGSALILDHYRLLALPDDVYFLDHVPFLIRPAEVALILVATAILAVGSAWIAAWRAASLQPIEALRR